MIDRTIGNYRILRKIGEGGMGAVYEAIHTTLGRRAAIKTLRPGSLPDANAAARFFNEAKAISMVSHPCLVTIYEHGTYATENGSEHAYIVMEYIAGESLRQRMIKRYLGGSSVELIGQLASALTVTHKRRIIHRDIKPENVMLVSDDTARGGVRAKLLDFGLAKVIPRSDAADPPTPFPPPISPYPQSIKTRTGIVMGTPAYMSPEQCRGAVPLDGKTDVYSLGLLFFEMLYGELPWGNRSAAELNALHLFAPPPDLAELMPAIPPKVAALIDRLLDKKPAARPSMEEFLAELQALPELGLSDGPAEGRPSALRAAAGVQEAGPGDFVLQQIVRPEKKAVTPLAEKTTQQQSPAQNSGAASLGEQVAPPRRPSIARFVVLGGMALTFAVAILLLSRPQLATSTARGSQGIPAQVPPAPLPSAATVKAPEPSTPPPPAVQEVKPSAVVAKSPSSRDKPAKKKPHETKPSQGTYEVRAWK
jgi:serine/threonine-protein kinase